MEANGGHEVLRKSRTLIHFRVWSATMMLCIISIYLHNIDILDVQLRSNWNPKQLSPVLTSYIGNGEIPTIRFASLLLLQGSMLCFAQHYHSLSYLSAVCGRAKNSTLSHKRHRQSTCRPLEIIPFRLSGDLEPEQKYLTLARRKFKSWYELNLLYNWVVRKLWYAVMLSVISRDMW